MNRLRDESVADPSLARGIDVVRSTPGAAPMPETKRRVWVALELGVAGARVREARRLSPFRILALTGMILCLGGTAGAVIGRRWVGPLLLRLTGSSATVPANNDTASPPPQPRHAARRMALETPTPPSPVVDEPAPPPARAIEHHTARPQAPRSAVVAPAAHTAQDGQVLEALVALRRDHDPVRAADLLARYLAEHPRGALREEAMVLSIEAADARGDKAAAEKMTRQYRASYPTGRFQRFVDGHIDGQLDPK
jgi:hypothetical protein